MDDDLLKYFIDRTDERFDKLEGKIDEILKFKWRLVGSAGLAGFLVSLAVTVIAEWIH